MLYSLIFIYNSLGFIHTRFATHICILLNAPPLVCRAVFSSRVDCKLLIVRVITYK